MYKEVAGSLHQWSPSAARLHVQQCTAGEGRRQPVVTEHFLSPIPATLTENATLMADVDYVIAVFLGNVKTHGL